MLAAHMIRSRYMFVLLVALMLGVSSAMATEDVPETAYDESESLPWKGTPLVSIAVPAIAAKVPRVETGALHIRFNLRRMQWLNKSKQEVHVNFDDLSILHHLLRC